MNNIKRTALLLSVIMLFTVVFCGCGKSTTEVSSTPSGTENVAAEQTLVVGGATDFKSGGEKRFLVFDTMTDALDDMSSAPNIITKWTANEDYTEYTLKIKEDVSFSDGTKLSADIIKSSLEYWPTFRSCGYINYIDSITAVDDATLTVKFKKGYGNFVDELSRIWVTKPESVDDKGNIAEWIGTGPYILQDYKADMSATLIRNDNYWDKEKLPGVTKIEFKVITDENARILAIQSGDVDVLGLTEHYAAVDYANVPTLKNNPNLNVQINDGYGSITTYSVNWKSGVCADKNIRKAISYGIDRETLCSKILFGVPAVGDKFVCTPYKFSPKDAAFTYDAEAAKGYLEAAGYSDSDGDGYVDKAGQKLTVDLIIKDGQQNRNVAVYIQECLKQIGIEIKLEVLDASTYKTRAQAGEYDLCATHPWIATVVSYLYWRGDLDGYDQYGSGYGVSGRIHELTELVSLTGKDEEREKYFDEIWDIEDDFIAGIPLFYGSRVFISQKNIEGLNFCPDVSCVDLSDVVIK